MKRKNLREGIISLLLYHPFFLIFFVVTTNSLAFAFEKIAEERLAVLDLEAKHGVERSLAEGLSVIVRDKLHSFGEYQVMSKSDIQAVASREQLMQAMGCDDSNGACLVDFGRAIGTRFMVAGDISKIGSTYTLSLRMLDTMGEKPGVIKRENQDCKCDEDALIETVRDVAAKLLKNSRGYMGTNPSASISSAGDHHSKSPENNKGSSSSNFLKDTPTETIDLTKSTSTTTISKEFPAPVVHASESKQSEAVGKKKQAIEEKNKDGASIGSNGKLAQIDAAATSKSINEGREDETRNLSNNLTSIGNLGQDLSQKTGSNSKTTFRWKEKKSISDEEMKTIILQNNFYSADINPNGSFDNDYKSLNSDIILDNRTDLMWQQKGSDKELSFDSTDQYIANLNKSSFGGYNDWRVPTIEELASIIDEKSDEDGKGQSPFSLRQVRCWSKDGALGLSGDMFRAAWIVNFKERKVVKASWTTVFGNTSYSHLYSNEKNFVRAVRTVSTSDTDH